MNMLTFEGTSADDPRIIEWIADHQSELGRMAASWFSTIRKCGTDVTELLHDGYPTACIDEYPFAYVGVFKSHMNVGFFYGSELSDPTRLLEGSGKRMRHVKLGPGKEVDAVALKKLVSEAYLDVKQRIKREQ